MAGGKMGLGKEHGDYVQSINDFIYCTFCGGMYRTVIRHFCPRLSHQNPDLLGPYQKGFGSEEEGRPAAAR